MDAYSKEHSIEAVKYVIMITFLLDGSPPIKFERNWNKLNLMSQREEKGKMMTDNLVLEIFCAKIL